ncbi:hypothetical protein [Streptomyces sp. NPDC058394]|uniref:zinc finger domain-containing protein n=1 Tax=Streptomyces sp. NPDC058394 TaxID=3346477 RepID=UPI00365E398D
MTIAIQEKAQVRLDPAGWVTVSASPSWWRAMAEDPEWPELAEYLARHGKASRDPHLCGVMGATTRRQGPCAKHPATYGAFERTVEETQRAEEHRQAEAAAKAAQAAQKRIMRATSVACGYCQATPGNACTTRTGVEVPHHGTRFTLAEHTRAASGTTCKRCGSRPGQLCKTTSGKTAINAHTARSAQPVP